MRTDDICVDAFMEEVLALRFGLNFAQPIGCNRMIINSDNVDVINIMHESDSF